MIIHVHAISYLASYSLLGIGQSWTILNYLLTLAYSRLVPRVLYSTFFPRVGKSELEAWKEASRDAYHAYTVEYNINVKVLVNFLAMTSQSSCSDI